MQRFSGKFEPPIVAVDATEPRLRFAANAGLEYASPVVCQSIKVLGMDCNSPTPPDRLRLCQPGVLEPPPVEIFRRALSVRQPHERRNRVDDRSDLAVGDLGVV